MKLALVAAKDMGLWAAQILAELGQGYEAGLLAVEDRNDPRSTLADLEALARQQKMSFSIVTGSADICQQLSDWNAECALAVGWLWNPTCEELQALPGPVVVTRSAPLPRYRGGSPLVWMILAGERDSGASLMWADGSLDEGDLLDQEGFSLPPEADINDAILACWLAIERMLRRSIPLLLSGERPRRPQPSTPPLLCASRTDEDSWIDWNRGHGEILSLVRGLTRPYPGARFRSALGEGRIFRAAAGVQVLAAPGSVVAQTQQGPLIACGDGISLLALDGVEIERLRPGVRLLDPPEQARP